MSDLKIVKRKILKSKVLSIEADEYDASICSSECPVRLNTTITAPPEWISDYDSDKCMICDLPFTLFFRRHHCRKCGKCVCSYCAPSENTRPIFQWGYNDPVRHCKLCYKSPSVNWESLS